MGHREPLLGSTEYHEIAPDLVLMAFFRRVFNGGGTLERKYPIGMNKVKISFTRRVWIVN
ncbi:MAG: hypothetical protein AAFS12_09915 [Cyanobacteria bacterium J06632_19]